jgi:hypothetical protein
MYEQTAEDSNVDRYTYSKHREGNALILKNAKLSYE